MCSDWHSIGYHSIAVHDLLILWWIPTAGKQKTLRFTFCATGAGRSEGGFLSQNWTGLNVFAAKLSITSACGGGVTEKDGEKEENRGKLFVKDILATIRNLIGQGNVQKGLSAFLEFIHF